MSEETNFNPFHDPAEIDFGLDEEIPAEDFGDTTPTGTDGDDKPEPATDDEAALSAQVAEAIGPAVDEARAQGAIPQEWQPLEYAETGNFDASALKLADSAVAPLVVMARGYETIVEDDLPEARARYRMPAKTSKQSKRLADEIARGDVLLMPWFLHETVKHADMFDRPVSVDTLQFRPAVPERNEKGKEVKYEFVVGQRTIIGVHPATPIDWLNTTPTVLIAEGLLKGDSAITGYLLHHGATREELSWTEADTSGDRETDIVNARARMAALLERIPAEERITVLTIGGVYNWRNNSEWITLDRVPGREYWLGVDGDVATNPAVHQATTELWEYVQEKKKATVRLIAPTAQVPDEGEKKVGIDDYLSKHGTWQQLVAQLAPKMPPQPPGTNQANVGSFRIAEDGFSLQECVPIKSEDDAESRTVAGRWVDVLPLGGRIHSLVAHRSPTPSETASGQLGRGANNDSAPWTTEVEVAWRNADGEREHHTISGPASILNYPPDQWDRHKAQIPGAVLQSPHWPPPRKIGEEWLRAVKAHRPTETKIRTRWDAMGWVPVENGLPAFIVGSQVIGAGDEGAGDIFPGVTENEIGGATRFGVGELAEADLDDPGYRASVRRDIEETVRAFLGSGAWTNPANAAIVVAAGLRPALPLRSRTTVYFVGPPRKGKTFSASQMMGFWSASPGVWADTLPGSAKDTPTSIEMAIARTPIWVIDDLAPATSKQVSEQEQSKVADVVRNLFNGTSKRRSTVDMGTRPQNPPRALLGVTAENELSIGSARDRCVHVHMGLGSLHPSQEVTDRVVDLCGADGAPARVTQALIKYLRWVARRNGGVSDGWSTLFERLREEEQALADIAGAYLDKHAGGKPGSTRRHAGMAADLCLSLSWLQKLASEVGVCDEVAEMISDEALLTSVFDAIATSHRESSNASPGRSLLEAISGLLRQGRAHVNNAQNPGTPPAEGYIASRLGWEVQPGGVSRGRGVTIGDWVEDEKYGQVVFIDQKAAFNAAQRDYPDLVPPGQRSRTSWAALKDENFTVEGLLRPGNKGKKLTTGRLRDLPVSGTPILVETLLGEIVSPAEKSEDAEDE